MYRGEFNRIYGARYDFDAITARISTQPSIVIPFIHSSPGLELPLCCGSRSFAPGTGANRRRVSVCLCVCACLSINNNLHSTNNNLFYPFPISHPFRSSVWLEVRSEVLGGQGFYSLFPPQSAPRVWDGLAELGSCQELAWQLSWTRGEKKKGKKLSPGSSTSSRQKSFAVKKNSNSIPNHSIQTPGTDRRYSLSSFVLRMLHLPPSQSSGNSSLSRSQSGNWFDASPFFRFPVRDYSKSSPLLVLCSYCYYLNKSNDSVRTYAINIAIAIETLSLTTAPM